MTFKCVRCLFWGDNSISAEAEYIINGITLCVHCARKSSKKQRELMRMEDR